MTSSIDMWTNKEGLTLFLLQTLMSVWETMAVIRHVLTLLDLTTATVNVAFSSSIAPSVMVCKMMERRQRVWNIIPTLNP